MPYQPSYLFDRTPEQKIDMFKSWQRDDQAFFASGACHILAYLFVQLHHHEGYNMVHIKPAEGFTGNHVFASNGVWAFDHNGWVKEQELLTVTKNAFEERYPKWSYEKIVIKYSTEAFMKFCIDNNHKLPWQYAYLPWERAYKYIGRFGDIPPSS